MDKNEIIKMLDDLYDLYAHRDLLNMNKQTLINAAIPPDVHARLNEIEEEFGDKIQAVNKTISELEERIRASVIEYGMSVKGAFLHAVYTRPRVTWDTPGLEGYAVSHPELLKFRREGEPYVSIRVR